MSTSYWCDFEEKEKKQQPQPQVNVVVDEKKVNDCVDELLGEVKEFVKTTALNLYQNSLANVESEMVKIVKNLEQQLAEKLTNAMLETQATPMPQGTRFAIPFGQDIVYLIEQEPCVRTIYHTEADNKKTATLSFPYMIFGLKVDKNGIPGHLHVGCVNKSLNSLKDPLYRIHLSNIYQQVNKMGVCDGAIASAAKGDTIAEKINGMIKQFWSSQWNGAGMTSHCNDSKVETVKTWIKNTKEDPLFVTKVKWESADITALKFAQELASYGQTQSKLKLNVQFREDLNKSINEIKKLLNKNFSMVLE